MAKILLIDDDERLSGPLAVYFARYDLTLIAATHPRAGMERLAAGDIDLVILDVMLPEQDGFEVCREIRRDSALPIIMLTARGDVMDRVVGLELGADDYLAKPFEPRELVARAQNILRRSARATAPAQMPDEAAPVAGAPTRLCYTDLDIDTELRAAYLRGRPLALTTQEYRLLELFARHPGKNFTRDEIIGHLRGTDADIYSRAVDILVSRLRQKLKPLRYIKTVWGSGYCFIGPRAGTPP